MKTKHIVWTLAAPGTWVIEEGPLSETQAIRAADRYRKRGYNAIVRPVDWNPNEEFPKLLP